MWISWRTEYSISPSCTTTTRQAFARLGQAGSARAKLLRPARIAVRQQPPNRANCGPCADRAGPRHGSAVADPYLALIFTSPMSATPQPHTLPSTHRATSPNVNDTKQEGSGACCSAQLSLQQPSPRRRLVGQQRSFHLCRVAIWARLHAETAMQGSGRG